jgi:hypothetical protein
MYMDKKQAQRSGIVIQWVGVLITLLGLAYTGLKDYQKGDIKFPPMPAKPALTKVVYPVQYCLMAYDPNVDKVFYLHENGQWHDYAPQQRRYESTTQRNQAQGQEALGSGYGTQGASGYGYGQSAQATAYTKRY